MCGNPPIDEIYETMRARNLRDRVKRPGPPNLSREKDHGVCAAKIGTVAGDYAHFFEGRSRLKTEPLLNPWSRERKKMKTAPAKNSIKASCRARTRSTFSVVKNPTAERFTPASGRFAPAPQRNGRESGQIARTSRKPPFLDFSPLQR